MPSRSQHEMPSRGPANFPPVDGLLVSTLLTEQLGERLQKERTRLQSFNMIPSGTDMDSECDDDAAACQLSSQSPIVKFISGDAEAQAECCATLATPGGRSAAYLPLR